MRQTVFMVAIALVMLAPVCFSYWDRLRTTREHLRCLLAGVDYPTREVREAAAETRATWYALSLLINAALVLLFYFPGHWVLTMGIAAAVVFTVGFIANVKDL